MSTRWNSTSVRGTKSVQVTRKFLAPGMRMIPVPGTRTVPVPGMGTGMAPGTRMGTIPGTRMVPVPGTTNGSGSKNQNGSGTPSVYMVNQLKFQEVRWISETERLSSDSGVSLATL